MIDGEIRFFSSTQSDIALLLENEDGLFCNNYHSVVLPIQEELESQVGATIKIPIFPSLKSRKMAFEEFRARGIPIKEVYNIDYQIFPQFFANELYFRLYPDIDLREYLEMMKNSEVAENQSKHDEVLKWICENLTKIGLDEGGTLYKEVALYNQLSPGQLNFNNLLMYLESRKQEKPTNTFLRQPDLIYIFEDNMYIIELKTSDRDNKASTSGNTSKQLKTSSAVLRRKFTGSLILVKVDYIPKEFSGELVSRHYHNYQGGILDNVTSISTVQVRAIHQDYRFK